MKVLETSRLILRTFAKEDSEVFYEMNSDPDVMRYLGGVLSKEESDAYLQRILKGYDENKYGLYAAELKETGEFIGYIGLANANFVSDFTPCVEIGWRLKKQHWKKGYATEGAIACIDYAFRTLELPEICSFTAETNTPSEKVMKRIGMEKKGYFGHPKVDKSSELHRHVLYWLHNK